VIKLLKIILIFIIISCSSNKKKIKIENQLKVEIFKSIDKGKLLFNTHCEKCHNLLSHDGFNKNYFENIPANSEFDKIEFLTKYIKNTDSLVQANDQFVIELKNSYGNRNSHKFNLTNEEIKNIIHFVNFKVKN